MKRGQIIPSRLPRKLLSKEKNILYLEKYYFQELEKIFKSQQFRGNLSRMMKWINLNYPNMASWDKKNKVQLPCQRLINYVVMKKLNSITGVYNSCISSDIAFETNNAIVNIDSKTVSSRSNKGDFESLFFGPNQSSFKHKNLFSQGSFPGLAVDHEIPSTDIMSKKPVLTFFLMIKYTDDGKNFNWYSDNDDINIRLICLPNGEISHLFNNDIISNVKDYKYVKTTNKNKKRVEITYPLNHKFKNSIPIKVYTKKGVYIPSKNETWLETDLKGRGTKYKNVIGPHSCRIDFSTLEDRYDGNAKPWKGVSNWKI